MKTLSTSFCLIIAGVMLGYGWHYQATKPVQDITYPDIAIDTTAKIKKSIKYKAHPDRIPANLVFYKDDMPVNIVFDKDGWIQWIPAHDSTEISHNIPTPTVINREDM